MASVYRQPNGLTVIQFIGPDGKRKFLRLGKLALDSARTIAGRVEQLRECKMLGEPLGRDLAAWLRGIEPKLRDKLAAVDLCASREKATLRAFIDAYFERRTDAKQGTIVHWQTVRRRLCTFFGDQKPLADITSGDAKDFRLWLLTENRDAAGEITRRKLSDNTARRSCGVAKQFLQDAVDRELIDRNPFKHRDVPTATSEGNKTRQHFIGRDVAEKVLKALPDSQWRLLFALSRYGGLRCPSEHLALRWCDVDWAHGRFLVTSSKTEHHEGKGSRTVPIFPELLPFLKAAHNESLPCTLGGSEFVITKYRCTNMNLRTGLLRYMRRAGIAAWPKLFHNLRASRQTELENAFPSHVVCSWLGNSEAIARRHYLQVTDEHFELAAGGAPYSAPQKTPEIEEIDRKASKAKPRKAREIPQSIAKRSDRKKLGVGDEGFEPPTSTV